MDCVNINFVFSVSVLNCTSFGGKLKAAQILGVIFMSTTREAFELMHVFITRS